MKSTSRFLIVIILASTISSCQSPIQRWLDGMTDYRQTQSKKLSLQVLRIKERNDTTSLTYRLRITPLSKGNLNSEAFYYQMDSCFYLKSNTRSFTPAIVQAVPSGIGGTFEYLLSFTVSQPMKYKTLQLVYQDRYIDGKAYILSLNKQ